MRRRRSGGWSRTSRGGSGLDLAIDLVVKDREVAKIHYLFSNVMVIGGTQRESGK